MSAIKPLVLVLKSVEGEPTVNVTLQPSNPQQGSTPAKWSSRETIGLKSKVATLRSAEATNRYAVTGKLSFPVLEDLGDLCCDNKVPQVAYTVISNIDVSIPLRATNEDRQQMLNSLRSFLNSAEFEEAVLYGESPY